VIGDVNGEDRAEDHAIGARLDDLVERALDGYWCFGDAECLDVIRRKTRDTGDVEFADVRRGVGNP